jgi:hypothetical protein
MIFDSSLEFKTRVAGEAMDIGMFLRVDETGSLLKGMGRPDAGL